MPTPCSVKKKWLSINKTMALRMTTVSSATNYVPVRLLQQITVILLHVVMWLHGTTLFCRFYVLLSYEMQ